MSESDTSSWEHQHEMCMCDCNRKNVWRLSWIYVYIYNYMTCRPLLFNHCRMRWCTLQHRIERSAFSLTRQEWEPGTCNDKALAKINCSPPRLAFAKLRNQTKHLLASDILKKPRVRQPQLWCQRPASCHLLGTARPKTSPLLDSSIVRNRVSPTISRDFVGCTSPWRSSTCRFYWNTIRAFTKDHMWSQLGEELELLEHSGWSR